MKAERENMTYISISCTPDELRRIADDLEAVKSYYDSGAGGQPSVVKTISLQGTHVCFTPDNDWLQKPKGRRVRSNGRV